MSIFWSTFWSAFLSKNLTCGVALLGTQFCVIDVANIFVDLGQGMNTVIAQNPSGSSSYRSDYLGFLLVTGTGNGHILFCDTVTNPPIYIDRKPNNNNLFVEIQSNTSPFNTDFDAEVGQYTLILSFHKQD